MKSYLSLIPISAKVHRKQNRMTILCIVISVFLVTAVFSMTEMAARQETSRLMEKHGTGVITELLKSKTFESLLPIAGILFFFVLAAGIFMISGSMNSNVAQRTRLFGMMRCIGMSRKQIIRYVRLEALNWCKTAVPAGIVAGTLASWALCAVLKYAVGGEWADMPQLKFSVIGMVSGLLIGVLTVLIAAGKPARRAAKVSPVSALSGNCNEKKGLRTAKKLPFVNMETSLGIRHASGSKKNLFLMMGSFALSIILFLSFSVMIDLVNCLMPQSAGYADIEVYPEGDTLLEAELPGQIGAMDGVGRAFARRAVFDVPTECESAPDMHSVDIISFESFDIDALKKDGMLRKGCDLKKVKEGQCALVITGENLGKGDKMLIYGKELETAGFLKYDPFSADGSIGGKTTLIVSDETFKELTGIEGYSMILIQLSNAAESDVDTIRETVGPDGRFVDNREANTRGTYNAFLICVYSFLGIIAMVTVLNIVNSISMSVSARITQYGAMRAVGMSKKQVAAMIRAEALTYAGLGCASGIALGLAISRWLYDSLVTSHFAYAVWKFPYVELAVIIVFFAVSVAAGTCGPKRRIERMSITETIRAL